MEKIKKITIFPKVSKNKDARFSNNGELKEVGSLEELHNIIQENSWAPATFIDNKRNNNNFISADFIALDIDGGLTVDEVVNRLEDLYLNYSLTYSRNHQKDKDGITCDRYRLVFELTETITKSEIFRNTWNYLYSLFPESDKATKDPARFYYQSCGESTTPPHLITNNMNLDRVAEKKEVIPEKPKKEYKTSTDKVIIIRSGALSFIENAHTGLNGSFNNDLNKAAYELARGGASRETALNLLEIASPQAFDFSDRSTFESGYNAGFKKGHYKEVKKNFKIESEDVFELLEEEFAGKYHVLVDNMDDRGVILKESANKIVQYVSRKSLISITGKLIFERMQQFVDTTIAKTHSENWVEYTKPLKIEPQSVAFSDEDVFAFHKLDFKPEIGETPVFDEFLSRCSDPSALMAFLWSLFETKSSRHQYLWLFGEGNNGKSSLGAFCHRLLGDAYITPDTNNVNQFWTSNIVGKRLAAFEDSNSRKFVQSGLFKQLTGNDYVITEKKGKDAILFKIDTKFMFFSNNKPKISNNNADQRRIIYCKVDNIENYVEDPQYVDKLWAEAPAILHKCKTAYQVNVINHGSIICKDKEAQILGIVESLPFQTILEDNFEIATSEDSISGTDFYRSIQGDLKRNNIQMEKFVEWLDRTYNVKQVSVGKNKHKYTNLKLRSL
jgi:hypothetical protein